MVDLSKTVKSVDIGFYSDASASPELGFGAVLGSRWIQKSWNSEFIITKKPSIKYLELFTLVCGILTWDKEDCLKKARVCIHCDNQAVVHMVNNLSLSCKNCMVLIRKLVLNGLTFNRRLTAKWIDTKSNGLSDALSRMEWSRFWKLGPNMNQSPDWIPSDIWSMEHLWID